MKPRPVITKAVRNGLCAMMTDAQEMVDEREATESKPDKKGNAAVHRGIAFLEGLLRWEGTHGVAERLRQKQARALLQQARGAIFDELHAASNDEVRQHPRLQAKARLLSRLDRWLKDCP